MELAPGITLGVRTTPSLPEELGSGQPFLRGGRWFVFDGRIDDRIALVSRLGLEVRRPDVELAATVFERLGLDGFRDVLGSFVLLVIDPKAGEISMIRDPLGGRTLFFAVSDAVMLVGSEEVALLAGGVARELDEVRLAQHFAAAVPGASRTFFRRIKELEPGQVLSVTAQTFRSRRFVALSPARMAALSDGELAEAFRERLDVAVADRMRTLGTGAALSGGLDSSSVVALAHRRDAELKTFSWTFRELLECDERPYIEAMVEALELDATWIEGDDCGPLADPATWPIDPSTPLTNPYVRLKQRVYRAARAAGVRALLTGIDGDALYTGVEEWLVDLVSERGVRAGISGVWAHLKRHGVSAVASPSMRRAFRVPVFRKKKPGAWLTPEAVRLVLGSRSSEEGGDDVRRPEQGRALRQRVPKMAALGYAQGLREGIEILVPFRDRRIIEFILAVPAHQLYGTSGYKHVLRSAMCGFLPEVVRRAGRHGTLEALFRKGIERERGLVADVLGHPEPELLQYVDGAWLSRAFSGGPAPEVVDYVAWQCFSFLLWVRAIRNINGAGAETFC